MSATGASANEGSSSDELAADLARRARALGIDHIPLPNKLTDEMKAWLGQRVSRLAPPGDRLEELIVALQSKNGLQVRYEAGFTGTAEEVFDSQTANCLSFTHLFVSMAREVGLQVYYSGVDRVQRFRKSGDLIVMTGHIAASWGAGPDRELIEFNVETETDPRLTYRISDRRAHALYYANRGAELLQEGDLSAALKTLTTSAILDVNLPDAWVNLGVVRRRLNDLDGAEQAYRRAVELEPEYVPAYHNLLMLLDLRGERDSAGELLRILDKRRNRNPFIFLELGDLSGEHGNYEEAARFYRRAQKLDRTLAEPHAAMGLLALAAGEEQRAREHLSRALELDPKDPRVEQLSRRLESHSTGS